MLTVLHWYHVLFIIEIIILFAYFKIHIVAYVLPTCWKIILCIYYNCCKNSPKWARTSRTYTACQACPQSNRWLHLHLVHVSVLYRYTTWELIKHKS